LAVVSSCKLQVARILLLSKPCNLALQPETPPPYNLTTASFLTTNVEWALEVLRVVFYFIFLFNFIAAVVDRAKSFVRALFTYFDQSLEKPQEGIGRV